MKCRVFLPHYWGPGGLLLFASLALTVPAHARKSRPDAGRVPTTQAQAFGLGFALQSAAAHTRLYLESVKGLRAISDDEEGAAEVATLAEQSSGLRRLEARAYGETARRLRAMGAPPDLRAWARDVADQLDAPLKLSKEAKKEQKKDPNTATVLGTIDEAQALKVAADGAMPGLRTWVKLSYGGNAAWAAAVGTLAAEMDASLAGEKRLAMSGADIGKLAKAAPAGTPPSVTQALDELTPRRGNLAAAINVPPAPVAPKDLKAPLRTLLGAFDARDLAETLNKS